MKRPRCRSCGRRRKDIGGLCRICGWGFRTWALHALKVEAFAHGKFWVSERLRLDKPEVEVALDAWLERQSATQESKKASSSLR